MPFIDILLPYPHSGADTKYRLLNLFLFVVLADLRISAFWYHLRCKAGVHSPEQTSAVQPVYSHRKAEHLESNQGHRARPCASTTDAILRIKTPPDKKGEKSGGVPNVWKDFEVFLPTPCYTIYYLKRTMWTKRTNFYFSFIHL